MVSAFGISLKVDQRRGLANLAEKDIVYDINCWVSNGDGRAFSDRDTRGRNAGHGRRSLRNIVAKRLLPC